MYKSNTLFDMMQLVPRPIPEQAEFEADNKEILNRMPYIMDTAFKEMAATRREKSKMAVNRNWPANEMSGNIWDLIAREFPHLIRDTKRGSFCLNMNDKYECYIKKLSARKLQPVYNHSIKSRQNCDQVAVKNEKALPVIFIGYTATKKLEVVTGFYAVCVKCDEVIWCRDLTDLLPINRRTDADAPAPDLSHDVTVTVKQKRKAQ